MDSDLFRVLSVRRLSRVLSDRVFFRALSGRVVFNVSLVSFALF